MPENLSAEMPQVDDTIPQLLPGESTESYKERLLKARQPVSSDDAMLKEMADGTYRDEKPETTDTPE